MRLDRYTVGKRYSKALPELVAEKDQAEAIYQELLTLHEAYHQISGIGDILSNDRLESYKKDGIMEKLATGFSEMMQNLLRVVCEYRRMYDLFLMIGEYERHYDEHQGLILGSVTTAIPLSKEQHQAMEEKVAQLLGYEQTHLANLIDPSTVGGAVIEVSRQVIDDSICKQLEHMQQKLLKQSLELQRGELNGYQNRRNQCLD